ncbi:MAG: methyltransferase [Oscillospiraceae bacterium]|nr:methyltransferase [Oscillospiraceae bacterium]
MEHYFKENEKIKHEIKTIEYYFIHRLYKFTTDAGIFSHEHIDPATDILLRSLPPLKGSVLDMGCGYGCIGIVLAGTYNLTLTQADINPAAVNLTKQNCKANNVESNVILSDGFEKITAQKNNFDTIVINPPIHAGKNVTYSMYEGSFEHLNDGGCLYVVTLKKHGAESTEKKLLDIFGNCETIYRKKGYFVFKCKKE